jgi:ADP-heptose:LPS heptosyltransferase
MLSDIKTRILKWIDHWVGGPICVILACINRLFHPLYHTHLSIPSHVEPKSILVMKFFGLGSIVLASSLLKHIKEQYPHARIIFMTFKSNENLAERLQLGDEIRTIDAQNPWILVYSIMSTIRYFFSNRVDISIDLEFYSKFSTLLSVLSGSKWKAGFYIARFWRNSLVNVPVYFNYARHILEIYSMVGKAVGVNVQKLVPIPIPCSSQEDESADQFLLDGDISTNDVLLGVNVNASDLAHCRKWPRERFIEVINSLLRTHLDWKIVLTGSQSERAYTAFVMSRLASDVKSRVLDLSGALNFGQFLSVLKRVRLLLTNDSGPFHLAKAQGTATVSIWGPGSPDLYGPYGEEKARHRVIYKRWSCSPCLYIYRTDAGHFCKKETPCLNEIGDQEVVTCVENLIRELG